METYVVIVSVVLNAESEEAALERVKRELRRIEAFDERGLTEVVMTNTH